MQKFFLLFFSAAVIFSAYSAEKKSSPEREILFLANINGIIENCNCPAKPSGGMGRLAAVISSKRQENPDLLFIDGGDFFNSYSYPELNTAVLDIYKLIKPDIITLGDQEFIEGADWVEKKIKNVFPQIVASNIRTGSRHFLTEKSFREKNKLPVKFLTYLDKNSFSFIPAPKSVKFNDQIFDDEYQKTKAEDILIVIYHGLFWKLKNFIKKYPRIDGILLGHSQTDKYITNKKPWIIGGGADGEFVIDIKLKTADTDVIIYISKIEIKQELPQDKSAAEIIDKLNSKNIISNETK